MKKQETDSDQAECAVRVRRPSIPSMLHVMNVALVYFLAIVSGHKIWEGRVCDGKRRLVRTGDEILFRCGGEEICVIVGDLRKYASFEQFLRCVGPGKVLPGIVDPGSSREDHIAEGVELYNRIYPDKNETQRFGVLGIQIFLPRDACPRPMQMTMRELLRVCVGPVAGLVLAYVCRDAVAERHAVMALLRETARRETAQLLLKN